MMLLSDIHSEEPGKDRFYSEYLVPLHNAQLLILAGDVGTFRAKDNLKDFLLESINIYPDVIWVPGNHEYDGIQSNSDLTNLASEINQVGPGKLHLLNRSSVTLSVSGKLITFIGCTLWSNAGWNRSRDRDSHLNPNQRQLMHLQDKTWLTREISLNPNSVVITHYPPITLCNSSLKEYYSNNLESLTKNVKLWLFGHLHNKYEIKSNDCLLISNPVGRFKDNISFSPNFISLSNF